MNKIEIGKYLTQIEEWEFNKAVIGGEIRVLTGINKIGLTPPIPEEPEWYIFNVCPYREIYNIRQNKRVFFGQIYCAYKVKLGKSKPSIDLLFSLMNESMKEFAKYYDENTKTTIINHHKVELLKLNDHKNAIKQVIDTWEVGIKNISNN
jgi:hypothetical protein